MVITLDWVIIEVAFVVATALLGFLIGWKYTAIWTVGVFFATIVASKLGPRLMELINKLLSVGAQFLAIGLGRSETSINAPTISIPDAQLPLATAVFFVLLTFFAAWIANKLGNNIAVGLLGKIMGAIFGALGTILILSEVSNYYQQFVAKNGSDPLANSLHLGIPTITLGFGGQSGAADWAGLGTLAVALFLMLLIIYTIWRVVRTVL